MKIGHLEKKLRTSFDFTISKGATGQNGAFGAFLKF